MATPTLAVPQSAASRTPGYLIATAEIKRRFQLEQADERQRNGDWLPPRRCAREAHML